MMLKKEDKNMDIAEILLDKIIAPLIVAILSSLIFKYFSNKNEKNQKKKTNSQKIDIKTNI